MLAQFAKLSLPKIFLPALVLALSAFLPAVLLAQQGGGQQGGGGSRPARENPLERMMRERHDRMMREMELRSVEMMGRARPAEPRNPRLAYEQIREDYQRLQVVNNDMMRQTFGDNAPATIDYRMVARATQEINRRASRLRSNMQLPELEESARPREAADITNSEQLRSSMLALDNLVTSFISNPIFRTPGVMDVEASTKARRDLEAMIELSKRIKRSAERLRN